MIAYIPISILAAAAFGAAPAGAVDVRNYDVRDIPLDRNKCLGRENSMTPVDLGWNELGIPTDTSLQAELCCEERVFDLVCHDICLCGNNGPACWSSPANCNWFVAEYDTDETTGKVTSMNCTANYNTTRVSSKDPNGDDGEDWNNTTETVVVHLDSYCGNYWQRKQPQNKLLPPETAPYLGEFALITNDDGISSTGVIGIHAARLPFSDDILYWQRLNMPGTEGQPGADETAVTVFDSVAGEARTRRTKYAPFCSGQTMLQDGSIFVAGGEDEAMPWTTSWAHEAGWSDENIMKEGRDKIRTFDYRTEEWTDWDTNLTAYHWYPTHLVVEDGRVINVGGWTDVTGSEASMHVQVLDPKSRTMVKHFPEINFTKNAGILNLYPSVLLLPYDDLTEDGNDYIFMYCGTYGEMVKFTKSSDFETMYVVDKIPAPQLYFTSYSAVGSGTLLAMKPDEKGSYVAEFVTFGGVQVPSLLEVDEKGLPTEIGGLGTVCPCNYPGSQLSARIRLDPGNPSSEWVVEQMPTPRVAGQAVVLPNGHVIIFSGAQKGLGNDYLQDPVFTPVLYNPYAPEGERYRLLASSSISRLYHHTAVLMSDGTVVIAGQDQGECTGEVFCGTNYEYKFEAERFTPPYLFASNRPVIEGISTAEVGFDTELDIAFSGAEVITEVSVVRPGAPTHSIDMSSRVTFLPVVSATSETVRVRIPSRRSRAIVAGPHMLFIMNGNVYSEGVWVDIQDAEDHGAEHNVVTPKTMKKAKKSALRGKQPHS